MEKVGITQILTLGPAACRPELAAHLKLHGHETLTAESADEVVHYSTAGRSPAFSLTRRWRIRQGDRGGESRAQGAGRCPWSCSPILPTCRPPWLSCVLARWIVFSSSPGRTKSSLPSRERSSDSGSDAGNGVRPVAARGAGDDVSRAAP